MTAVNSVGNTLTGLSGTGAFVGATSPTIVTPVIGTIKDTNSNTILNFAPNSSAVNYLQVSNGATSAPVELGAIGSDTDIGFVYRAKGTGIHQIVSAAANTPLVIFNGTSSQHQTNFNFVNSAASQTVSFPDLSGTVALSGASQAVTFTSVSFGGTALANYVEATFTPSLVSAGGGGVTYTAQAGTYTRIGNKVLFNLSIILSGTTLAAGSVTITGLPIALGSGVQSSYAVYANNLGVTAITQIMAQTGPGLPTSINLYYYAAGSVTALDGTQITATSQFFISGQYTV